MSLGYKEQITRMLLSVIFWSMVGCSNKSGAQNGPQELIPPHQPGTLGEGQETEIRA